MDGAPVRGECIPVRLFLKDIKELRPTMQDIANFFSVRYFLNLVLTDEDDRRYYKQQVIFTCMTFHTVIGIHDNVFCCRLDEGRPRGHF